MEASIFDFEVIEKAGRVNPGAPAQSKSFDKDMHTLILVQSLDRNDPHIRVVSMKKAPFDDWSIGSIHELGEFATGKSLGKWRVEGWLNVFTMTKIGYVPEISLPLWKIK